MDLKQTINHLERRDPFSKVRIQFELGAPRWAGIKNFVEEAAAKCNVEVKVDERKGFLKTLCFCRIEGLGADVLNTCRLVDAGVEQYMASEKEIQKVKEEAGL